MADAEATTDTPFEQEDPVGLLITITLVIAAIAAIVVHEVRSWDRPEQGQLGRGPLPTHTPAPLYRSGGDQAHRPTSGHPHGANDVRDRGPRLPQRP